MRQVAHPKTGGIPHGVLQYIQYFSAWSVGRARQGENFGGAGAELLTHDYGKGLL